jgi:nucleotide-binding universal stress UspA family protein
MKLICATDFSPPAEVAVNLAVALARRLGDELELVHVTETPTTIVPEFAVAGSVMTLDLEQEAARRLTFLTERLRGQGVTVSWKTLSGFAEEVLVDHAKREGTRALVVGTHGRRGPARLFLGGVAERLIRSTAVPLLVVPGSPQSASIAGLPADKPLRLVAGVDRSRATDAVLAWLRTFLGASNCDLRLVHAYWPLREHVRFGLDDLDSAFDGDPQVEALLERELRPHINELLGGRTVSLQLRPTLGRDPDPLAREGELAAAHLLVVGAGHHGRRGGSTAVATVRAAKRPVLCVPPEVAPPVSFEAHTRPLRTLLVPVDLSPSSQEAVAMAYRLLRAGGGIVELLHIVEPTSEGVASRRGAEIEQRISALVPGREQHGILARPTVVESSSPAQAILQAAERLGVDAVVMAAHEHSRFRRAITGSVVDHISRASNRPVVVVPAGARSEGG